MQEEPAKELLATEHHRSLLSVPGVVLPPKGYLALRHVDNPVVGNGNAMGVSGQVMKNVFGPSEGGFGIDHPVVTEKRSKERAEGLLLGQEAEGSRKGELSLPTGVLQSSDEFATKHPAEHLNRQEESVAGADPLRAVEREAPGGDHTVDVRVNKKILTPSMQDTQEPDAGAEVPRIRRDFQQSGSAGPKQDVVHDLLVLESQPGEFVRKGEDHVKIADRKEFPLTFCEPPVAGAG